MYLSHLSYSDDASAELFKEAGVQLRRYDPNRKFVLPAENEGLTAVKSEPHDDRDTISQGQI